MHSGVAFFSMPFLYLCSLIEDSHIIQAMSIQGMTDFVKWYNSYCDTCRSLQWYTFPRVYPLLCYLRSFQH